MTIHELLQAAGLTANDEIPIWDADGTGEPTKKITAQQLAAAVVALANLVTSVNNQTGAVSLTPANIGAVAKSGDTMTGPLTVQGDAIALTDTAKGNLSIYMHINGLGDFGIYSNGYYNGSSFVSSGKWLVYRDRNDVIRLGNAVPVDNGGTGATDAAGARANLGALGSFITGVSFGGDATNFYQNLGAQISTMADYEARLFGVYADATSEPFYQGHTYSGKIIRYNSTTCSGILTDETGQAVIIGCSSGTWSVRSL